MSKPEIDYSNTIIYKITCKDPNVKDLYVGHTVDFVKRKQGHKYTCINENSPNYKCKLYETIRTHGGWSNWNMEIVNFFKCKDKYEARTKEQEYFELLNATLNSVEPFPKPKVIVPKKCVIEKAITKKDIQVNKQKLYNKRICKTCEIECSNKHEWFQHILSDDHKNKILSKNVPERNKEYICEICNFICSKQSDYNRHLSTDKHVRLSTTGETNKNPGNICKCGERYKHKSSLSRHKQTCKYNKSNEPAQTQSSNDDIHWMQIIQSLIKENQETRNIVITQHNALVEHTKSIVDQNKTLVDQNISLTELFKNQNNIFP
jgi:GIY-YIG catalytic domain